MGTEQVAAVVVVAVVSAALATLGPWVLRRLPEPEPDPDAPQPEQPKELYVDIAALPRLASGLALAALVAGGLVGWRVGWTGVLPLWCYLVPLAVLLSVVDWRTRLLPTRIIAPSYGVVVALVLLAAGLERSTRVLVHAGLGWLVMGGVFLVLWLVYPKGLGYGDVRLSGLLGIGLGTLGWPQLLTGLYAAFLLGGFGGLLLSRLGVVRRRSYPFGPFMTVGALVGVLFGVPVLNGLGY